MAIINEHALILLAIVDLCFLHNQAVCLKFKYKIILFATNDTNRKLFLLARKRINSTRGF